MVQETNISCTTQDPATVPDYDIPTLLPAEIRHLRLAFGWSQVRMGEFLGYDAATISRWESGHYVPDPLAAGVLYRLWNHAFGDERQFAEEVPSPPASDALRSLGALLLGAGVAYVIAKGLENLDDEEDGDNE